MSSSPGWGEPIAFRIEEESCFPTRTRKLPKRDTPVTPFRRFRSTPQPQLPARDKRSAFGVTRQGRYRSMMQGKRYLLSGETT
jgi:hypothetical protein